MHRVYGVSREVTERLLQCRVGRDILSEGVVYEVGLFLGILEVNGGQSLMRDGSN